MNESKRIGYIKITIEPWVYDSEFDVMKFEATVNGRKYHQELVPLRPDDITSRLDQIFDMAKAGLKRAIEKDFDELADKDR